MEQQLGHDQENQQVSDNQQQRGETMATTYMSFLLPPLLKLNAHTASLRLTRISITQTISAQHRETCDLKATGQTDCLVCQALLSYKSPIFQ